jgi:hypothetical protein
MVEICLNKVFGSVMGRSMIQYDGTGVYEPIKWIDGVPSRVGGNSSCLLGNKFSEAVHKQ